jgi:hypothetical protein
MHTQVRAKLQEMKIVNLFATRTSYFAPINTRANTSLAETSELRTKLRLP